MPYKEFEGKTIDKAVKIACTELNISKSEIKYDVISKGSNSIFGLVSIKKAKIKVTLPKNGSQPKHDKDSAKSLVDMAFSESKYDDQPSKKEITTSNWNNLSGADKSVIHPKKGACLSSIAEYNIRYRAMKIGI